MSGGVELVAGSPNECDAAMQNMEYSNSFELSASASQFDIKGFGQNGKQLYSRHMPSFRKPPKWNLENFYRNI